MTKGEVCPRHTTKATMSRSLAGGRGRPLFPRRKKQFSGTSLRAQPHKDHETGEVPRIGGASSRNIPVGAVRSAIKAAPIGA